MFNTDKKIGQSAVDYEKVNKCKKIGQSAVDYEKVNKCKNRKNKKRDFWQINAFRFGNLSVIKKEKKKYESKKIKIKFFSSQLKLLNNFFEFKQLKNKKSRFCRDTSYGFNFKKYFDVLKLFGLFKRFNKTLKKITNFKIVYS